MLKGQWYKLMLIIATNIIGSCLECDDPAGEVARIKLTKNLESILLHEANLYELRRAFYYSPTAAPVLIKVVYNITHRKSVAADSGEPCSDNDSSRSNSTTEFESKNITYGLTLSGVYTLFHPLVLNAMQAQLPFAAMRVVHLMLDGRSPEADTFLWDGSYELPQLHLNLNITSLDCVPSQTLLESALKDINTLVSPITAAIIL